MKALARGPYGGAWAERKGGGLNEPFHGSEQVDTVDGRVAVRRTYGHFTGLPGFRVLDIEDAAPAAHWF